MRGVTRFPTPGRGNYSLAWLNYLVFWLTTTPNRRLWLRMRRSG